MAMTARGGQDDEGTFYPALIASATRRVALPVDDARTMRQVLRELDGIAHDNRTYDPYVLNVARRAAQTIRALRGA